MKKETFSTYFSGTQNKVHCSKVFFSYGPWKFKTAGRTSTTFCLISANASGMLLCVRGQKKEKTSCCKVASRVEGGVGEINS